MKKIYSQFVAFSVVGVALFYMSSCKKDGFLGQTQTSNLTPNNVFTDSARTVAFLTNIYNNVGFSFNPGRFLYGPDLAQVTNGGLDAASDEAEVFLPQGSTALAFASGTINAAVVTDDAYKTSYTNIRSVNQLLANITKSPINAFVKTQMKAEARFLRAWYYAILVKHYGGVHLVGDSIYTYTDHIPAARNTYEQCVNYILSECDAAGNDLPVTQSGINYGRASKGACLALKSRVLLYAASPQFNDPSLTAANTLEGLTGYPKYDPDRWKLAKAAAEAVIGTGSYSLVVDNATRPGFGFQFLFTKPFNTEYIFAAMRQRGNADFESLWDPPSRSGRNGAFPLQGLVDAFPMSNGLPITDPASGYNPQDPYKDRDPRLDNSIIHDQTPLLVRLGASFEPIDIFIGSYQGRNTGPDAVRVGTRTGYYTNKMLDPNAVSQDFLHGTDRAWPLMRYAEILLNFAEATNEVDGPTGDVYTAIGNIRQRAGLVPFALPAGLDKNGMRLAIQNERRIELAFEEHRFWDVRRWKIADQTDNIQTMGMEVDRDNNTVTYKTFPVRKRNFRAAMYLWPLPESEVAKSPEVKQNPGY
ncbi:Starch-binding associating with outer membrane [Mucilaginibacter pineti]|uniref:Starch-binding associating with outer membrane n=1 Tax=Mucilaginibacter pineti TaxID=1391627 RepID=A0A1G7KM73_9SPHI|nr:RagB/SusD family nutrient uptake outer membrane protein [Mucilaginibacter pineti]SDF38144.1 Starch-binding associating with outer membrane [Mucilaginibacter pineti]